MNDVDGAAEPGYHLHLDAREVLLAARALRLFISDEAHEPGIRTHARAVIGGLQAPLDADGRLTLELSPQQMKITHSATRLLLNDLQREQASEREILRGILQKLPDEHTMRAIELD